MFQAMEQLKIQLQTVCQTLLTDLPNIRIAMIAIADYCDAEAFYVLKKMEFSNDLLTIQKFVRGLLGAGGGDEEECYELALLEARMYQITVIMR